MALLDLRIVRRLLYLDADARERVLDRRLRRRAEHLLPRQRDVRGSHDEHELVPARLILHLDVGVEDRVPRVAQRELIEEDAVRPVGLGCLISTRAGRLSTSRHASPSSGRATAPPPVAPVDQTDGAVVAVVRVEARPVTENRHRRGLCYRTRGERCRPAPVDPCSRQNGIAVADEPADGVDRHRRAYRQAYPFDCLRSASSYQGGTARIRGGVRGVLRVVVADGVAEGSERAGVNSDACSHV